MIRRLLRTITIPLAVVLLLSAVMAPGVLAKGRPARVEFSQASCGDITAQVSWWKKSDVHEIRMDVYFGNSLYQTRTRTSGAAPFTSPQLVEASFLPFAGGATTYRVDVFLYSDSAEQNQVGSGTASITIDCVI